MEKQVEEVETSTYVDIILSAEQLSAHSQQMAELGIDLYETLQTGDNIRATYRIPPHIALSRPTSAGTASMGRDSQRGAA